MYCDPFRPILMTYIICISSIVLVLPEPPGTFLGPAKDDKGIALDDVIDWPVVSFPSFGKTNRIDTLHESCGLNFLNIHDLGLYLS